MRTAGIAMRSILADDLEDFLGRLNQGHGVPLAQILVVPTRFTVEGAEMKTSEFLVVWTGTAPGQVG
jgi:hypothetical protein